jgi:hypothetical protein
MKVYDLEKEELELSKEILCHLTNRFKNVYLKIHPGDWLSQTPAYHFFLKIIQENPQIHLVDNDALGEEVIEKYEIGIIASPVSTLLFNSIFQGCEPIFFYHLLPYRDNFSVYNYTLKELGYNFIRGLDEVSPSYKSGVDAARLTFRSELIDYASMIDNHGRK